MTNPPYITSISKWERIKGQCLLILSLSVVLGFVYPVLADGFGNFYPIVNGIFIGILGGIFISLFELHIFYESEKKFSFGTLVFLKVIAYSITFTFLILAVVLFSRSMEFNIPPHKMVYDDNYRSFLFEEDLASILTYALSFVFIVIFIKEIAKKIGVRVLLNFITGKYHWPREENKIFMFLDLDYSTKIAEEVDDLKYHKFLNQFFKDITKSILFVKGEIYQYVGDEMVVTWPLERGFRDSNCIYAYFYSRQIVDDLKEQYMNSFGFIPSFKASIHLGPVIRGEVGDVKSEIVYHGDTINTAARIERLCSKLKEPLLISEEVVSQLPPNVAQYFQSKGGYKLRGKEELIEIFGLKNKDQVAIEDP